MPVAPSPVVVSTILHVEDDVALRALVEMAFSSFGFRGKTVAADSVADAIARLDDAIRAGTSFDLIISDMNLPDGSGLDVVRYVRSSAIWRETPVLILSGDVDPKKVGKAYALGANAYLDKAPHGKSLAEVLRSTYQHWTNDVVLPKAKEPEHIRRAIARSICIRRRHAELYQRLADMFDDSRSESAFWLSRALAESNLINLLGFLRNRINDHDLPEGAAQDLEEMQTRIEALLRDGEAQLDRGTLTRDRAYSLIVELVTAANLHVIANWMSHLFPKMAVAMDALHDFLVGTVHDVAAWVDLHATDPALRERALLLRTRLAALIPPRA